MKISTIFKTLLYLFIGLVLAAVIVPFVFKDRIIEEITKLANENINATVSFESVDASLLRSFPNLNIRLEGLEIKGKGDFQDYSLLKTDVFSFDMNISPLYDESVEPVISYLGLTRPIVNVMVLENGTANYNITLPDSTNTESQYFVKLDKYEIKDGIINYEDKSLKLKLNLTGFDHIGKGDFSEEVFDLATSSSLASLYARYDGLTYINKLPAKMDALININFPESKYTLKDNSILINKLALVGDGFIQLNGDNILTKANISFPSNSFGDLVSAFPYIPIDEDMNVSGEFSSTITIDGIYNSVLARYPAYDIALNINNGVIKYNDLPYPVKDINTSIKIKSTKPDMKDLMVDISNISMRVNNEEIKGEFVINNGLTDPLIDGTLDADINLENWSKAIYIEGLESISGQIFSDLKFKGKLSDVERENYQELYFTGEFKGTNLNYKVIGSPKVVIERATLNASPKTVSINTTGMSVGNSSLSLSGKLDNPLAFLSDNVNVNGEIAIQAAKIDFNEWMSSQPTDSVSQTNQNMDTPINLETYKSSDIKINASANEIYYEEFVLKNSTLNGKIGYETIEIDKFETQIGESDMSLKGKIVDAIGYFNNDAVLKGSLDFTSNNFNTNQFMTTEDNTPVKQDATNGKIDIPENIDIKINTKINNLIYTDIEMTNFTGQLNVKDKAVELNKINGSLLQGELSFDGLYDSKPTKPTFDTKVDMSKIKFNDAYEKFVSIRALAPIAKFIEGFFNTTLVFSGELENGMVPNFNTLNASGFIETFNSTIKNANPIEEVANKLNIEKLKSLKLDNTKNWFEIKNGLVDFKERDFDYQGVKGKINGQHKIQGEMDYTMLLAIPRELIKGNKVGQVADQGLSFLESKAKSLGLNIEQGEYIDIKVIITGKLLNPKVSIIPVGSSGNSVKEEVESTINDVVEQAKDTIRKELDKKKEQLKDTLTKVAEKEIDKAKEKAKEEANKAVEKAKEKAKQEANKVIDSAITKVVTDSLAQKAKDALEKQTGTTVDDLKDKIKDWNPFKKKKGN